MSNRDAVTFRVEALCVSQEKGTVKTPVPEIDVTPLGFDGDAHAGSWHRQVSLLAAEDVEAFAGTIDRTFQWGEFAENITTRGIDLGRVAVLDRIRIGDVELEITQIGKACHHGCDIFKQVGACIMPKQGLFARVITPGHIVAGCDAVWVPRPLKIRIITLSDRAHAGVYDDRSGPAVETVLETHFAERRDHPDIQRRVLPDDPAMLQETLHGALKSKVDLVITVGGTGIGRRDYAPEVTSDFITRPLPGLMEHIRHTYGVDKPAVYLSRGVAGTRDGLFVINTPGSVKGATEYVTVLMGLWDHIRRMIHGIDKH
ncbi:MAG TPA: molybdopterin-binding protein [bacterium]|nr:molybdopterin-binding protein [bacterium]